MHHSASDPSHVWHGSLLKQFPFVHCVEAWKGDCLRPMHSLMHGLDNATSLNEYMGAQASLALWKDCVSMQMSNKMHFKFQPYK